MLRIILTVLCVATGSPVFAQTSGLENYPNRAVRVVAPFPPGGPTDTYARILANKLQAALGSPSLWRTGLAPPVWASIIKENNITLGN